LYERYSFDSLAKLPIDGGIDPDIELYARDRYCRFVSADNETGIGKLRELYDKYRAVSFDSFPMKLGITPVRDIDWSPRDCKFVSEPMVDGRAIVYPLKPS